MSLCLRIARRLLPLRRSSEAAVRLFAPESLGRQLLKMFDAEILLMNETVSMKSGLSRRSKKPSTYRRIVTGNVNGKAVVRSDEPLPAYEFKTVRGYEYTLIWVNPATPDLSKEQTFDSYPDSVVPGPGGTSLHFVTFPPGSAFADPSFDATAAQEEALVRLRGLADHFEKEDPAMHKTNTVDYSVVYRGEIWMELDDGETVHLKRGDVVVQNGTRHAWRNKGTKPVTMLFFLNGAREKQ
jgi:mannose-6-phosphate isomerase-like protein (cupin superfamily)